MSASEAIKILGVQSKSDKAAILSAHRSLMK
jgi:DnaJ-domain-containing protein 1